MYALITQTSEASLKRRSAWIEGRATLMIVVSITIMNSPAHLVITCVADNDKGVQQLQEVIDVTFSESQGRTTVTVNAIARGPSDEAAAMLKGMDKGWAQTVDRLAAHLRRK